MIEYKCPFPGCRHVAKADKNAQVFCDNHAPAKVVMRPVRVVPSTRYDVHRAATRNPQPNAYSE